MSSITKKVEGIECTGNICGLEACKKHKVEVIHHNTSDTVSIHVDDQWYMTVDDSIWSAILKLENE